MSDVLDDKKKEQLDRIIKRKLIPEETPAKRPDPSPVGRLHGGETFSLHIGKSRTTAKCVITKKVARDRFILKVISYDDGSLGVL